MANPLVSFCVKSYNQKALLKEALHGAFAQTYRPLEIVISDDGSTDGSWEVILSARDKFLEKVEHGDVPGDVSVVVNRNENNLGNLGNWQKICEIAKGELFIKADGDDISMPTRTEEVVKAWIADGKKALVVYHGAIKIDGRGREFGEYKKGMLDYGPAGAVSAYSRKLFDSFGPIEIVDKRAGDDTVYGNRSYILGASPLWVGRSLAKCRVGSGEHSGISNYRKFMLCGAVAGLISREQSIIDVKKCKLPLPESVCIALNKRFEDESKRLRVYVDLWGGESLSKRLTAYRILCTEAISPFQRLICMLLLFPHWISDPILNSMKMSKYFFDRMRYTKSL